MSILSTHSVVLVIYLAAFAYSIILHEIAHGWVAKQCGDYTAEAAGRLSLNPIRHIDPVMSILMPIVTMYSMGFPFGGAKPVPVNPYNFRNPERDDIKVSLAGVAVNFLIALVFGYSLHLLEPGTINYAVIASIAVLNVALGIFNLVPVPPLDGSHVLKHLLYRIDPGIARAYESIGFFGLIIIVVLLRAGSLPLWKAIDFFWYNVFLIHDVPWELVMIRFRQ